jgi:predicted ATPase/class 3 adenylate cyclase
MASLPTGTVTFMFTDLEGSTRLWEERPESMEAAMVAHDALLRESVESSGGMVVGQGGDGMFAVFASASDAIAAGVRFELRIAAGDSADVSGLLPRVALHAGDGVLRADGEYVNRPLNRCSRLLAAGHGGQMLVSGSVEALVGDALPPGVELVGLGEHRLRDLARPMTVFQLAHPELRREFPPLRSLDSFLGNLPMQMSSFIGRERELVKIVDALTEARVVTLTGAGGVGKTRLAFQVAAELLPRFREGAWLVELAPVRDSDGVGDAFAAVFGVTAGPGRTLAESLVEFFGTKQLLVVVDNCEHLLDPVAELVEVIGQACAGVVVLATSREGLAVDGERVVPLPSLAGAPADADVATAAQADAVHLFVERARGVDPDFELTASNVAAVAQVCRRLDGLPLAIELAAARVTSMSPAELAAALDRRFDVLAGGRRGAVKRQQTLRATIDWSYDLLDEPRRHLLTRLSVFAGGCTRDAAAAVCAGGPVESRAVPELLGGLVDRSLVVAERGGLDTRFRLSETIREYGEERLAEHGETAELRDRHARYYAEARRALTDRFGQIDEIVAAKRVEADGDNLIAALAYAVDQCDLDLVTAVFDAMPEIGGQSGLQLRLTAGPVLALPGVAEHPGYPLVLVLAALEAEQRGEFDLALERVDDAIAAEEALSGQPPYHSSIAANAAQIRGLVFTGLGRWNEAADAFMEAAAAFRELGSPGSVAMLQGTAAGAMSMGGGSDKTVALAADALALARSTGSPIPILACMYPLALALADEDPAGARVVLGEALELIDALEFENTVQLTGLTLAAAAVGDAVITARLAARAIRHLHWSNDRVWLGGVLIVVARLFADVDGEAAVVAQSAARGLMAGITAEPAAISTGPVNRGSAGRLAEANHDTTRLLAAAFGADGLRARREHVATLAVDDAIAATIARLTAFVREQELRARSDA